MVPDPPGTPVTPHFEIGGYQYFAQTGLYAEVSNRDGDGTLRTPTGRMVAVNWDVDLRGWRRVDSHADYIQIYIADPVRTWEDLRREFAFLLPDLGSTCK
jgi:hypothetical protein